ncbi:hypothetical protein RSOLAG22IIIB_07495 [Rhizoctonia solani]|uniref:Laminin domain protein n=1 Tax=Rhizoctonia solani TaxID=456999 RepID=A0A0K6FNE1_9AGAM|nr:hypothetical protein RSOLAG22IIIB_07495 [Rhizoctonia solani]
MVDYTGWYPPGQVCSPPELPVYLKNVYDLKPIIGVPNDAEVIGIHAVIEAARKTSDIPGMHTPGLLMRLTDHLFGAQMARYRNKYSLITFPSDAIYTPPTLPDHIPRLEAVSGAPADAEIIKVQDAFQTYQELKRIPSMFDSHVNMELSQHLFNIQMARYMRLAGESQPSPPSLVIAPIDPANTAEQTSNTPKNVTSGTNNAGTGSSVVGICPKPGTNTQSERPSQSTEQPDPLVECLNQVLEMLTRLVEHVHPPGESSQQTERFNQLFERFNQLVEQSAHSAQRANELTERSNQLTERGNQLMEHLTRSSDHSNYLADRAYKYMEGFGDTLRDTNGVMVAIQHAIVRGLGSSTINALDCLVNTKGETPGMSETTGHATFKQISEFHSKYPNDRIPVIIGGTSQGFYSPDWWLGRLLCFYGIGSGICENETTTTVKPGKQKEAREMLSKYLSSCLG